MREAIDKKEPATCLQLHCNGLVKPDIVFFGEALPSSFFTNRDVTAQADLCIIMGTSLSVMPFAALPQFVPEGVPRVLINLEQAGDLGSRPDDVLLLGDCDDGVRRLAGKLGWGEELEAEWAKSAPTERVERPMGGGEEEREEKTRDEVLEEEVEALTKGVEETLKLNEEHVANLTQYEDVPGNGNGKEEEEARQTVEEAVAVGEATLTPVPTPLVDASSEVTKQEEVLKPKEESKGEPSEGADSGGGGLRHVFVGLRDD